MEIINILECTKCEDCSSERNRIYYGYEGETNHNVAFIFRNPGNHDENTKIAHKNIYPTLDTFSEKIIYWRDDYLPYLVSYKYFFLELLLSLNKVGLINPINITNNKSYMEYILDNEGFFKNIYITDAAKCSGDGLKVRNYNECLPYLKQELLHLTNLKLIFCFGVEAFNSLNSLYKNYIKKVEVNKPDIILKHGWIGDLYVIQEENNEDIFVIRSVHNSYRFLGKTNLKPVLDNALTVATNFIKRETYL